MSRTKRMQSIFLFALMVMFALALAACGSDSDSDSDKDKKAKDGTERPEPGILAPKDGTEVLDTFTAGVALPEDFQLDPDGPGSKKKRDGYGWLKWTLDDGKFDTKKYSNADDLIAKLSSSGEFSPSTLPQMTYTGIPKGTHTLVVELVENDGSGTGTQYESKFKVVGSAPPPAKKNDK